MPLSIRSTIYYTNIFEMIRIKDLKAKHKGRMYDVRALNFSTGNVILCAEGKALKHGWHTTLDKVDLYCTEPKK